MAIKTFTTGEVLTASDTNTYLANSGLVYVTSATLTGTAIQINNCFTSTYDWYQIVWSNSGGTTSSQQMYLRLSSGGSPSATGYDTRGWYSTFGGGSGVTARFTTEFGLGGADGSNATGGTFELQNPAKAQWTTGQGMFSNYDAVVFQGGRHAVATAYDGAYIFVSSGSMSGTLTIYGHRKS